MDVFDLALAHTPRIGGQTANHLIDRFFSAENIFSTPLQTLIQKAELNPDVATSIVNRVAFDVAQRDMEYCAKHNIEIIAAVDPNYPPLLRETNNPPYILYAQGNTSILTQNLVAIVGTRKNTSYGERATINLVEQLAKKIHNIVIVSGLAYGIDAVAHRAALAVGVPTVAIVPTALPSVTPSHHASLARDIIEAGGVLLSEISSQSRNNGRTFISRNRIIAGASAATIVAESPIRGGSIATADIASSLERSLFAIPGRITDEMSMGCNRLIANKVAEPLLSAEDLIRELGWGDRRVDDRPIESDPDLDLSTDGGSSSIFDSLSCELAGLLACFLSSDSLHISELCELTSLPSSQLSAMLLELELAGAVRALPGSRYERIIKLPAVKGGGK